MNNYGGVFNIYGNEKSTTDKRLKVNNYGGVVNFLRGDGKGRRRKRKGSHSYLHGWTSRDDVQRVRSPQGYFWTIRVGDGWTDWKSRNIRRLLIFSGTFREWTSRGSWFGIDTETREQRNNGTQDNENNGTPIAYPFHTGTFPRLNTTEATRASRYTRMPRAQLGWRNRKWYFVRAP